MHSQKKQTCDLIISSCRA